MFKLVGTAHPFIASIFNVYEKCSSSKNAWNVCENVETFPLYPPQVYFDKEKEWGKILAVINNQYPTPYQNFHFVVVHDEFVREWGRQLSQIFFKKNHVVFGKQLVK